MQDSAVELEAMQIRLSATYAEGSELVIRFSAKISTDMELIPTPIGKPVAERHVGWGVQRYTIQGIICILH